MPSEPGIAIRRHVGVAMAWMFATLGSAFAAGPLDPIAESYVRLVLAVGVHEEGYVDFYLGPEAWQADALEEQATLVAIRENARSTLATLRTITPAEDEMERLRHSYLETQIRSIIARTEFLEGKRVSFDEESKALYGAVAPHYPNRPDVVAKIDGMLPGSGPIEERYEEFIAQYRVPVDRLAAVFEASLEECRRRTAPRVELPPEEVFDVEYVHDKPWSGYNSYLGGYHSLIQLNADVSRHVDEVLDLACHEGLPGHHLYSALLERELVGKRRWMEFSVYPIFSPLSLVAEGSASIAADMAFPGEERNEFEQTALFELAGLEPDTAPRYHELLKLKRELRFVGTGVARQLIDGEIDEEEAADRLVAFGLWPRDNAVQTVGFFTHYRSYYLNYTAGEDLVRSFVERGGDASNEERWERFLSLLTSPMTPANLEDH